MSKFQQTADVPSQPGEYVYANGKHTARQKTNASDDSSVENEWWSVAGKHTRKCGGLAAENDCDCAAPDGWLRERDVVTVRQIQGRAGLGLTPKKTVLGQN